MLAKLKDKIAKSKAAKWVTASLASLMMASFAVMSVFAEDPVLTPQQQIDASLETMFNSIKDSLLGYIAVALPIAALVIAAVVGVRFAVRFFLGLTKSK